MSVEQPEPANSQVVAPTEPDGQALAERPEDVGRPVSVEQSESANNTVVAPAEPDDQALAERPEAIGRPALAERPPAKPAPLVSVIMPVYNSAEYVGAAAKSVLAQSYANLELVLVDDGSTDGSGEVCDELAAQDGRVVVVHKPNGGICSARNAGLDVARGTYVAFCDNDDEYLPGLLEDNVRIAEEGHKDVVRFQREHLIVEGGEVVRREVLAEGRPALDLADQTMPVRYFDLANFGWGIWTGLYRRQMLIDNGVRFLEDMRYGYEDMHFNLQVFRATGNIACNPQVYYRWSERYAHSTSRKFSVNRLDSLRTCLRLEGQVGDARGIARTNPTRWAGYLVDTYAIRVLQQLTLPICDLSKQQKVHQLELLAAEPAMRQALQSLRRAGRSVAPKTRLVAALLRARRYRALIALFVLNARREGRVY